MTHTKRIADELRAALYASGREIAIEWAGDDQTDDAINVVNERFHLQVGHDYVCVVESHYDASGELEAVTHHAHFGILASRPAIHKPIQLMEKK